MSQEKVFQADINDPDQLISEFFSINDIFSNEEKDQITNAWNFLVENCKSKLLYNEPYYLHPLRVANILAGNKLDKDSIISAILHPAYDLKLSPEEIKEKFGDNVYNIMITTNKILSLPINTKTIHQSDAIRNMLFAMSNDARIILITLADRLDRIRNMKNFSEEDRHTISKIAIEIWAPLADRLGMQSEKNEFEDLSLKYTNPQVFLQIKAIVAQKKDERAAYLEKAVNNIYKSSEKLGIKVEIQSRAKHFYSIYQKMRKRNKEASELFDLFALRILCNTTAECYTLVGIVHSLWKPLDGRFKDYIAMPKSNGYQSLHTTVMCEGKPLEIQIRTHEMHNMAEHGIASHWLYKKGTNKDLVEVDKLEIINKLQRFKEGLTEGDNFEALKNELLGDEIYVFTPKGDVKKLPMGANAIDFAYSIHSGVGEKIIAAKADGKIIPLTKPLANTQIIEIITNPQAHPTEAQLKVVKTSKARQKIHSWLMANDPTFSEQAAITSPHQEENDYLLNIVAHQRKKRPKNNNRNGPEAAPRRDLKVLIEGNKNVVYNIAQCCKPKYPDIIVGYMTLTKGISIHKADCLIYQRIPNKEKKTIEVSWDTGSNDKKEKGKDKDKDTNKEQN